MKKYYSITILAFIVITLLQGYNISLQYKDYIYNETDRINSVLKVAVDEEYAVRAQKMTNRIKMGNSELFIK